MGGCPRTLILDVDDLENAAAQIRHTIEQEGNGAGPLAPTYLERIVGKLAGTLVPDNEADVSARELEDEQD